MVSRRREETGLYREIAGHLPLEGAKHVLDVGTGSGLQLRAIHDLFPDAALHGLDLSAQAIAIAEANLADLEVDLRAGSIEGTPFDDETFDVVTCASSMSYWQNLVSCFDEVYRILRPGGCAVFLEPRQNIDIDEAVHIIRRNLAGESWLRRFAAVNLNRFGLRWGRTLGLHLYAIDEVDAIARRSRFGDHVSIEPAVLQNLPIFMRIQLAKPIDRTA
jgi:SAM-dependent methyltransferase